MNNENGSEKSAFNFEAWKKQLEDLKKQFDGFGEQRQKEKEKEVFAKLLETYDSFLPQVDVAKWLGATAEQLEKAAQKLKEYQKMANKEDSEKQEENNGS